MRSQAHFAHKLSRNLKRFLTMRFKRGISLFVALAYVFVTTAPVTAGDQNIDVAPHDSFISTLIADFFRPSIRRRPVSVPTPQPRGLQERVRAKLMTRTATFSVKLPKELIVVDWRRAARDPRAFAAQRGVFRSGLAGARNVRRFGSISSMAANTVVSSQPSLTGEVPWWQYQPAPLPGVGSAAVNLANGNLVIRSLDMNVPHKGVPFTFVRTFNSDSLHNTAGSDGSQPSVFGNGWTNNFDAHIANNNTGGISVYSDDGARYDFTPTTSPSYPTGWMPPAGVFEQLSLNSDGTYDVTETSGVVLRFYAPSGTQCPTAAVCGRLQYIIGRNHYTSLGLTYGFSQQSMAMSSMSEITVTAEDGEVATMTLSPSANGPLLSQLTWPGGQAVTYGYDSLGNLNAVDEVGNNNTWIPQSYGYNGSQLSYVTDPRFSNSPNPGPCGDGNYEQFNYDTSERISSIQANGVVNVLPSDGTSTALQPSQSQDCVQFLEEDWTYGSGSSTFSDTNGHQTTYTFDSLNRVTATTPLGGSGTASAKVVWNASNEVTSQTDVNGNQYNIAYDSNGNHIAISSPRVTTSSGTVNPTWTASFDANSNILAECDPNWNAAHSTSWSGTGTPPACTPQSGVPYAQWTTTTYEPYGELTSVYTSRGYKRSVSYSTSGQGGADYGLPTSIIGASITEADSSSLTPTESYTYDIHGNQISYNFGPGSWYFTYDGSNRIVTTRDPDGYLAYTSWYPNGDQQLHESAEQYALESASPGSGAVRFTYDPDRNTTSVTHHYGYHAGTTNYWYDAANRLVETAEPVDPNDEVQTPFMARYLYDNSQGGTSSILSGTISATFPAHGNLYATEFFIPSSISAQTNGWVDYQGFGYDSLDRPTARFSLEPTTATSRPWRTATWSYGSASPNLDNLATSVDELGATTTYAFNAIGQMTGITYPSGTPSETLAYDADGQLTSVAKTDVGTESYSYDSDGNLATQQEPGTGLTSPAKYTFGTYLDGVRSSLSVASSGLNVSNLFQYVHRVDGLQTKQLVKYSAAGRSTQTFTWSYSPAGRLSTRSDDTQTSTLAYDVHGLPTTDTIPGTQLTYSFDPEGLLLSTGYKNTNLSATYTINTRGETTETQIGTSSTSLYHPFAGMMFPDSKNTYDTTSAIAFDPIDSGKLGSTLSNATEYATQASIKTNWLYDAAGRVTGQLEQISNNASLPSANNIYHSYDSSNHMTQTNCVKNSSVCPYGTVNYQYDSEGHVISIKGDASRSFAPYNAGTETLHWADGQLLFTTNSTGALDDLKIGTIADVTTLTSTGSAGTNLTYWDRDISGNEVSWHALGQTGSAVSPGDPVKGYSSVPTTGSLHGLYYISQDRTDGYSDGVNNFQGDRISNSRLDHWMTRDADFGSLGNPLSLKPYVLDSNNPSSMIDPSGHFPIGFPGETVGAAAATGGLNVISDVLAIIGAIDLFFGLFGGGHHGAPPILTSPDYGAMGMTTVQGNMTAGGGAGPDGNAGREAGQELGAAARRLLANVLKGKIGEQESGVVFGPKERVDMGKYNENGIWEEDIRYPDGMTDEELSEVKNVKKLYLSSQLKAYMRYAAKEGKTFVLVVRKGDGTQFTPQLDEALKNAGAVVQRTIGNF